MSKIFYDHLTVTEEVYSQLDKYQLTVIEREEIIQIMDENIHHRVLNLILSKLPKEKHEEFLMKFHHKPHDQTLLEYIKKETQDIEKLIEAEAKKVKEELLQCIKKSIV